MAAQSPMEMVFDACNEIDRKVAAALLRAHFRWRALGHGSRRS